jgi:hypothetical protein
LLEVSRIRLVTHLICGALLLLMTAQCSSRQIVVPNAGSLLAVTLRGSGAPTSYLYAAQLVGYRSTLCAAPGGCVGEFATGATVPMRLITSRINYPTSLAQDASGNLYVANTRSVTVYAPGTTAIARSLQSIMCPVYVVSTGQLVYVAENCPRVHRIDVYSVKSNTPISRIINGIFNPTVLALRAGTLYVGNRKNVSEYPPNATSPSLVINDKIDVPKGLGFDKNGNLYVANSGFPTTNSGSVAVYNSSGKLLRNITQNVSAPLAVAFGGSGNLFVANVDSNTVSVFRPNSTVLVRVISLLDQSASYDPETLLVGNGGNIYVGGFNLVDVFLPGGSTPIRTLSLGGGAMIWGKK